MCVLGRSGTTAWPTKDPKWRGTSFLPYQTKQGEEEGTSNGAAPPPNLSNNSAAVRRRSAAHPAANY